MSRWVVLLQVCAVLLVAGLLSVVIVVLVSSP
jgi:hypothetical protein